MDEYHILISDESLDFLIGLLNELNQDKIIPLGKNEKKIVSRLHEMFCKIKYYEKNESGEWKKS